MLIIEKRKDSQTLVTMGADTKLLRKIFVAEGMLIYLIGAGGRCCSASRWRWPSSISGSSNSPERRS